MGDGITNGEPARSWLSVPSGEEGGMWMRDPTVKFALKLKDLLALQALADERNQSMARLLRDLVRDATRQGRKAGSQVDGSPNCAAL
jgi:hypothetical protein